MELTRSQWYEWKQDVVTQQMLKALVANRIGRLEEIAHGHASQDALYLEIGRVQGIEDALQFLVEDVKDSLIDDKETEDA